MAQGTCTAVDRDKLIEIVRDLVSIPSVSGDEKQIMEHVASFFDAAGIDYVVRQLCGIFGNDARKYVGRAAMTNWSGERWVRGAYAAARPGRATARAILSEPVGERIWFAGEHLAGPLIQTCGGARLSGEAVARQVMSRLPRL